MAENIYASTVASRGSASIVVALRFAYISDEFHFVKNAAGVHCASTVAKKGSANFAK